MSYFYLLIKRAKRDTALLNRSRAVTTLGAAVLAVLLQWMLGIRPWPATLQIAATVLLAYAIVLLVSFLWNFGAAPARIHQDQETEIGKLRIQRATEDDRAELSRRMTAGNELLARGKLVQGEAERLSWSVEHTSWLARTVAFMKVRFSEPEWQRVASVEMPHGGRIMSDRDQELEKLALEIHRIDDILKSPPKM